MRYAILILLCATVAVAGWNKATYAIVNKPQLDAKIASGDVKAHILMKKLKGYPNVTLRKSLDSKWVLFESEKNGDIAYLRNRAAQEGIGYTEYTPAEISVVMGGTNWTPEVTQ